MQIFVEMKLSTVKIIIVFGANDCFVKWPEYQILLQETHVPKVMSSNPGTIYWMDIFSRLFVVKIVCLKKMKIN